jgi:hypothetical protein
LSRYKVKKPNLDVAIYDCISMLASALGTRIEQDLTYAISFLLEQGISDMCIQTLEQISSNVPTLSEAVQCSLLGRISEVLNANNSNIGNLKAVSIFTRETVSSLYFKSENWPLH